jgi:hypothetical protein
VNRPESIVLTRCEPVHGEEAGPTDSWLSELLVGSVVDLEVDGGCSDVEVPEVA